MKQFTMNTLIRSITTGYFFILAAASTVGGQGLLTGYVDPAKGNEDSVIGLCTGGNGAYNNEDGDLVNELCVDWIRLAYIWPLIQPNSASQWDFQATDDYTQRYYARGLNIMGGLGYTPNWASVNPTHDESSHFIWSTQYDDEWYNYVFNTVSRYKHMVKVWQIWNEINTHYWQGFHTGGGDEMGLFARRVMIPAYEAAKSADPNCQVFGISFGGYTSADDFWKQV